MTDTPELSPLHNGQNLDNTNINNDSVDDALIEKMKGDAIGQTLYSQRFVLKTLMKLPNIDKPISEYEDYEKDLCTVWDQTVEKDVVNFLLEYKVLEIFSACLENEDDGRLTEILVGIIANMCALRDTRCELESSPQITITIISLISSDDPLVLIQLMRFFHAVLIFENSGDELIWFQYFAAVENFVEKFSFVLASSTSSTLLRHTLEALHAICAKFAIIEIRPEGGQSSFVDMFVVPLLVSSLIEAFNQVVGGNEDDGSESLLSTPTENTLKFMSLFLDVNVILTQYDLVSKRAYSENLTELLNCLGRVLKPFCYSEYLFPLSTTTQGIIENLSDILQALNYPFGDKYWQYLVTIYTIIVQKKNDTASNKRKEVGDEKSEWDSDSDDDNQEEELDTHDLCHTILEILSKTASNINNRQKLEDVIKNMREKPIKDFLNSVESNGLKEEREMIKDVLSIIKQVKK